MGTTWPLAGRESNGSVLIPQGDRSVIASGSAEKSVYSLKYATKQPRITGSDWKRSSCLPVKGVVQGLSKNGNFVITELELLMGLHDDPSKWQAVKVKSAEADYSQSGFSAAALLDGRRGLGVGDT